MLFLINVFLPALNSKHCDEEKNGYSCEDLNRGILKVKQLLKFRRKHYISAIVTSNHETYNLYSRLFTLILALATNSTPYFVHKQKISQFGKPFIAYQGKKPLNQINYPPCFDLTSLNEDLHFKIDPIPSQLLLSPATSRIIKEIGPASLHILIHLALNISNPITKTEKNYSTSSNILEKCNNNFNLINDHSYESIFKGLYSNKISHQITDIHGWLLHLLTGSSPILYDISESNLIDKTDSNE